MQISCIINYFHSLKLPLHCGHLSHCNTHVPIKIKLSTSFIISFTKLCVCNKDAVECFRGLQSIVLRMFLGQLCHFRSFLTRC